MTGSNFIRLITAIKRKPPGELKKGIVIMTATRLWNVRAGAPEKGEIRIQYVE
jgi:hypothetical protein